MDYIWKWYQQLKGPQPLSNTEILSWACLYGIEPTPREVELLRDMDDTLWRVLNDG
ncbi:hypothetical protein [Vibrio phage PH669]|uniref:Uncharacterized protein n=1 Tax=Vibrio phage PH669 TaxID=2800823 RepID=A0A7T7CL74_9CAUD|nr:hypothetical protein [Vibrio phage PH669]